MDPQEDPIACPACFSDQGLKLDAERLGQKKPGRCPSCGADTPTKLPLAGQGMLAHRFFVWGSLTKSKYGAAPVIQFNKHQKTSIGVSPWLSADLKLLERLLDVGFFHYGPRLWMIGEVEPLKDLQRPKRRKQIIDRILEEYPTVKVPEAEQFYRIRVNPGFPNNPNEFDSAPPEKVRPGRLSTTNFPIMYASSDLEVCVHECRAGAEDDLFVATLVPTRDLRLLNLAALLKEENVTEFESLDMAVHMLFLAGKHSYPITRSIATAAKLAGFDGVMYPSYFSLLRTGTMPLLTTYGLLHRRIPQLQDAEQSKLVPNLGIFGRPLAEGLLSLQCINKLILSRVVYDYHFGPAM